MAQPPYYYGNVGPGYYPHPSHPPVSYYQYPPGHPYGGYSAPYHAPPPPPHHAPPQQHHHLPQQQQHHHQTLVHSQYMTGYPVQSQPTVSATATQPLRTYVQPLAATVQQQPMSVVTTSSTTQPSPSSTPSPTATARPRSYQGPPVYFSHMNSPTSPAQTATTATFQTPVQKVSHAVKIEAPPATMQDAQSPLFNSKSADFPPLSSSKGTSSTALSLIPAKKTHTAVPYLQNSAISTGTSVSKSESSTSDSSDKWTALTWQNSLPPPQTTEHLESAKNLEMKWGHNREETDVIVKMEKTSPSEVPIPITSSKYFSKPVTLTKTATKDSPPMKSTVKAPIPTDMPVNESPVKLSVKQEKKDKKKTGSKFISALLSGRNRSVYSTEPDSSGKVESPELKMVSNDRIKAEKFDFATMGNNNTWMTTSEESASDDVWEMEERETRRLARKGELLGQFARLNVEHGAMDVNSEAVINLFIKLSSQDRKIIMADGGIKNFLAKSELFEMCGPMFDLLPQPKENMECQVNSDETSTWSSSDIPSSSDNFHQPSISTLCEPSSSSALSSPAEPDPQCAKVIANFAKDIVHLAVEKARIKYGQELEAQQDGQDCLDENQNCCKENSSPSTTIEELMEKFKTFNDLKSELDLGSPTKKQVSIPYNFEFAKEITKGVEDRRASPVFWPREHNDAVSKGVFDSRWLHSAKEGGEGAESAIIIQPSGEDGVKRVDEKGDHVDAPFISTSRIQRLEAALNQTIKSQQTAVALMNDNSQVQNTSQKPPHYSIGIKKEIKTEINAGKPIQSRAVTRSSSFNVESPEYRPRSTEVSPIVGRRIPLLNPNSPEFRPKKQQDYRHMDTQTSDIEKIDSSTNTRYKRCESLGIQTAAPCESSSDVCVNTVESCFDADYESWEKAPIVKTRDTGVGTEDKVLVAKEVQTNVYGKNFWKDKGIMTEPDVSKVDREEFEVAVTRVMQVEERLFELQLQLCTTELTYFQRDLDTKYSNIIKDGKISDAETTRLTRSYEDVVKKTSAEMARVEALFQENITAVHNGESSEDLPEITFSFPPMPHKLANKALIVSRTPPMASRTISKTAVRKEEPTEEVHEPCAAEMTTSAGATETTATELSKVAGVAGTTATEVSLVASSAGAYAADMLQVTGAASVNSAPLSDTAVATYTSINPYSSYPMAAQEALLAQYEPLRQQMMLSLAQVHPHLVATPAVLRSMVNQHLLGLIHQQQIQQQQQHMQQQQAPTQQLQHQQQQQHMQPQQQLPQLQHSTKDMFEKKESAEKTKPCSLSFLPRTRTVKSQNTEVSAVPSPADSYRSIHSDTSADTVYTDARSSISPDINLSHNADRLNKTSVSDSGNVNISNKLIDSRNSHVDTLSKPCASSSSIDTTNKASSSNKVIDFSKPASIPPTRFTPGFIPPKSENKQLLTSNDSSDSSSSSVSEKATWRPTINRNAINQHLESLVEPKRKRNESQSKPEAPAKTPENVEPSAKAQRSKAKENFLYKPPPGFAPKEKLPKPAAVPLTQKAVKKTTRAEILLKEEQFDMFAPAYLGNQTSSLTPRNKAVPTAHYNPGVQRFPIESTQQIASLDDFPSLGGGGDGIVRKKTQTFKFGSAMEDFPSLPPPVVRPATTTSFALTSSLSKSTTAGGFKGISNALTDLQQTSTASSAPATTKPCDKAANEEAQNPATALESWTKACTKKKGRKKCNSESDTPVKSSSSSSMSMAMIVATRNDAAKGKGANFNKLVDKISENYPRLKSAEIMDVIQGVRDSHGGLKGIPMRDILKEVGDIVTRKGFGMRSLSAGRRAAAASAATAAVTAAQQPEPSLGDNLLFKTSICEFWKFDACHKGANCVYAHGRKELRPLVSKNTLCAHVGKGKQCKHGDKCIYAHSAAEIASQRAMFPEDAQRYHKHMMQWQQKQQQQKQASSSSYSGAVVAANLTITKPITGTPSAFSVLDTGDSDTDDSDTDDTDPDEDDDQCCICLSGYRSKDVKSTLDCGHWFHTECIRSWNKVERTCPMCRNHALSHDEFPALK